MPPPSTHSIPSSYAGKQIPTKLLRWWEQAERNTQDGKKPLLVLHPLGTDYADSLAVVRLADRLELLKESGRQIQDEG